MFKLFGVALNLLSPNVPFLYASENVRKPGYLTFSGGIEKKDWAKMDKTILWWLLKPPLLFETKKSCVTTRERPPGP